jgi:hypothetical protein
MKSNRKRTKIFMLSMFCSILTYGQSTNFAFTYGGENFDTEARNLSIAKDKSIITTSNWHNTVFAEVNALIVHKASSEGKLKWKTILECSEALPCGLYELPDSSIVVLADVYKAGEKSIQIIKLNKSGGLVSHKGYSNKNLNLIGASIIGSNNYFYVLSYDAYSTPKSSTIQKFDQDLNKISSITFNDVNCLNGRIFENKLILTGYRDTGGWAPSSLLPVLVKLDSSLNVLESSFFTIKNPGYTNSWGTKVIIDQNTPIIIGDYNTNFGLAKRLYIYPEKLSMSKFVSGDFIADLTIRNANLYIAAGLDETVGGIDAYIAKYDLTTETKKWVKGYGTTEDDALSSIKFEQDKLYAWGISRSFSNRTSTRGYPVTEAFVIQTDSMGRLECSVDITTEKIYLTPLIIEQTNFVCSTYANDTTYTDICYIINPSYFDSLACVSEPATIKTFEPNTFKVFPNITKDKINIISSKIRMDQSYELMNIIGQRVLIGKLESSKTELDISNQANGMYLLRIFDESKRESEVFKIHKITD